MSDFPDITPEDRARWFDGTRIAFDRMLDDGFRPLSIPAHMNIHIDPTALHPYDLYYAYQDRIWRSGWDLREERDDSLDGVESFDMRQRWMPAHAPLWGLTPENGFTYTGFRGALGEQDHADAEALAAAINAPPRFRIVDVNRATSTITVAGRTYGIEPVPLRLVNPGDVDYVPRTRSERKAHARASLRNARPPRRLDGRRG